MTHTNPQIKSEPDHGGIGWLVPTTRQLLVHFRPDPQMENAAWVSIRTYRYVPPRPPEPITHQRVLRQNAKDTWKAMLKSGWHPCRAPAR